MTVDDAHGGNSGRTGGHGRSGDGSGEPGGVPPTRSTTRDLERYAGLFASRTRGMRSSAMRDMMAVTERPEVISLAGGLPDTSTFPPDTFAAATSRIAAESCARALQYGPTEGLSDAKACIAEVMAAEGMVVDDDDLVVTTGGQQVIDLVTKTLIDPGDVVVAEGPTYPGAVPVFSSYQADLVQVDVDEHGMRVGMLEDTLDRLEREGRRPKFVYTVPSFQNPAGVTMSLERRRQLVDIARRRELLVLEDNPYGLLRYEGSPEPTLRALDGVRRLADRNLPRAARHDARRARGVLSRRGGVDSAGRGPVHLGHAPRLHRHDRPAGARAARERRVRPRRGRVPRRAGPLVDAAQLLGLRRGRGARGRATDRQGRLRAGGPVRDAHRARARAGPSGRGLAAARVGR